jgi:hypothetical protein
VSPPRAPPPSRSPISSASAPSTKPRNSSPLRFPDHHPRLPCVHVKPSPPFAVRAAPLLALGAVADGMPRRASRAAGAARPTPQSRPLEQSLRLTRRNLLPCQRPPRRCWLQPATKSPWPRVEEHRPTVGHLIDRSDATLASLLAHRHCLPTDRPPLPPQRLTGECPSSPLPQMGPHLTGHLSDPRPHLTTPLLAGSCHRHRPAPWIESLPCFTRGLLA